MVAEVDGQGAVVLAEQFGLAGPVARLSQQAMQDQERRAAAYLIKGKRDGCTSRCGHCVELTGSE